MIPRQQQIQSGLSYWLMAGTSIPYERETLQTLSLPTMDVMEIVEEGSEVKISRCHRLIRRLHRLNFPGTFWRKRPIITILIFVVVSGIVIFLGLFPASFVYIEYFEVALKQSKLTGALDRKTVYYSGCYLLGPDVDFITFPITAQEISRTINVFTTDTVTIEISFTLLYFLRATEVGQLYAIFSKHYNDVFVNVVISSIRNLASSNFSVDYFRFNRTHTEYEFHEMLKAKLEGNCCPSTCSGNHGDNCIDCKTEACNHGYHIDVRHFYLRTVSISDEALEQYLQQAILKVGIEEADLRQDQSAIEMETKLFTTRLKNVANETVQKSDADSKKLLQIAETEHEIATQTSLFTAMINLYSLLNITREDRKLSLPMLYALKVMNNPFYYSLDYEILARAIP